MQTRNSHGIEIVREPAVRSGDRPRLVHQRPTEGPAAIASTDGPLPPSRRFALVMAASLVVALAASVLLLWLSGDDGDDVVRAGAPAPKPAAPAELGLTVTAPPVVVAGERATFTVAWTDGDGEFAGGNEEWGDGVGASSISQGTCPTTAVDARPSGGTYDVTYTWAEPGTYSVVIGVSTYSCDGGKAVTEDASRMLQVEVLPAG